ncbi:hypothetical protein V8G54_019348 [Vigna mungo]|uniref:Uncharacterized protein n=1 Tax=Vigna mungo TaxID=3915 RepID=A0AAQ3RTN5_VIGMU
MVASYTMSKDGSKGHQSINQTNFCQPILNLSLRNSLINTSGSQIFNLYLCFNHKLSLYFQFIPDIKDLIKAIKKQFHCFLDTSLKTINELKKRHNVIIKKTNAENSSNKFVRMLFIFVECNQLKLYIYI